MKLMDKLIWVLILAAVLVIALIACETKDIPEPMMDGGGYSVPAVDAGLTLAATAAASYATMEVPQPAPQLIQPPTAVPLEDKSEEEWAAGFTAVHNNLNRAVEQHETCAEKAVKAMAEMKYIDCSVTFAYLENAQNVLEAFEKAYNEAKN